MSLINELQTQLTVRFVAVVEVFVVGWVVAFEWFGLGSGDLKEATAYFCILEIVVSLQLACLHWRTTPWDAKLLLASNACFQNCE